MKLQKLTEKRWFWPLVCAVSVVFGWWYLSIVTCAPLVVVIIRIRQVIFSVILMYPGRFVEV